MKWTQWREEEYEKLFPPQSGHFGGSVTIQFTLNIIDALVIATSYYVVSKYNCNGLFNLLKSFFVSKF